MVDGGQPVDGWDAEDRALINLCLATGNIGRPGSGPLSLTGQPNATGGRESGGLAGLLPGRHRQTAPRRSLRRRHAPDPPVSLTSATGRDRSAAGRSRGRLLCGRLPFAGPFPIGHECVAEVIAVGNEVRSIRPGQRVVVPWAVSCRTCPACRRGLTSMCTTSARGHVLAAYGFGEALAGGAG